MKRLFHLLLLITSLGFSQPTEFTFTKDGFTDYVVIPVEGKTAAELYTKTLEWINKTYNDPKEVLKGQVQDDYIRFEGASENLVTMVRLMKFSYSSRYQIEVSFQDNKFKFDLTKLEYYIAPNQYGTGGWYDYQLTDMSEYFNKKGVVKGTFKNNPEDFTIYFNGLVKRLKDYIIDTAPDKKKDW